MIALTKEIKAFTVLENTPTTFKMEVKINTVTNIDIAVDRTNNNKVTATNKQGERIIVLPHLVIESKQLAEDNKPKYDKKKANETMKQIEYNGTLILSKISHDDAKELAEILNISSESLTEDKIFKNVFYCPITLNREVTESTYTQDMEIFEFCRKAESEIKKLAKKHFKNIVSEPLVIELDAYFSEIETVNKKQVLTNDGNTNNEVETMEKSTIKISVDKYKNQEEFEVIQYEKLSDGKWIECKRFNSTTKYLQINGKLYYRHGRVGNDATLLNSDFDDTVSHFCYKKGRSLLINS